MCIIWYFLTFQPSLSPHKAKKRLAAASPNNLLTITEFPITKNLKIVTSKINAMKKLLTVIYINNVRLCRRCECVEGLLIGLPVEGILALPA